jgi:hypothetical protein
MTIAKQNPTVLFVELITPKGNRQYFMSARWESVGAAQRELTESLRSKTVDAFSDFDNEGKATGHMIIVNFAEIAFISVKPVAPPKEPQDTIPVLVRDHA